MDYEIELRNLPECFVSHAEIEYLVDSSGTDSGFIDPNALSAGGFPFVLRTVLEQINLDGNISQIDRTRLYETVCVAFPALPVAERYLVAGVIAATLSEMGATGNLVLFCGAVIRKASILNEMFTKDYSKRLKLLFGSPFGVAWILPSLWRDYRMNKVKRFIEIAKNGGSIKFFNKQVISQIYEYMETFVGALGEVRGPIYTTYDVEWESDMSYYIAEKFAQRNITTAVLIDLHANSALFSDIPLQAIVAPYGSSALKEVYQALVNPEISKRSGNTVFIKKGEIVIDVSGNGKKLSLGPNRKVLLNEYVVTVDESMVGEFKQYAYLWEHFGRAFFQRSSESHRKMYLSNLLNAKNAFFTVLEQSEQQLRIKIAYPKTYISEAGHTMNVDLRNFSQVVAVKEGGWCSTGGKQVNLVQNSDVSEFLSECSYEGVMIQNYVPSILFNCKDAPYHGHVRKASIISRQGVVTDAGYVLKLIEQEKGNSSAYRSHMLYFDKSGKFVFGKEIGGAGAKLYTRLEQAELVPVVDMRRVFGEVRAEWSKAMYAVNKFISENDIYEFARKLAKDGKLSKRYLVN